MFPVHKKSFFARVIYTLLFLFLSSYANLTWSLEDDRKEKVHVVADSFIHNFKTGVNIYEGNVLIDQGTTHLTADRLITKNNDKNKMQEAIAYGLKKPAHYWTVPKPGDPIVDAFAKVIKFYPIQSYITLERDVVLLQGDNRFEGQLINYSMQEKIVTVPASPNGRAVLIYDPDK